MQTRDYSYTRVLPSFNIKFDVSDKFIIRGAASMSTSPPNLNDIRAGGFIERQDASQPDQFAGTQDSHGLCRPRFGRKSEADHDHQRRSGV